MRRWFPGQWDISARRGAFLAVPSQSGFTRALRRSSRDGTSGKRSGRRRQSRFKYLRRTPGQHLGSHRVKLDVIAHSGRSRLFCQLAPSRLGRTILVWARPPHFQTGWAIRYAEPRMTSLSSQKGSRVRSRATCGSSGHRSQCVGTIGDGHFQSRTTLVSPCHSHSTYTRARHQVGKGSGKMGRDHGSGVAPPAETRLGLGPPAWLPGSLFPSYPRRAETAKGKNFGFISACFRACQRWRESLYSRPFSFGRTGLDSENRRIHIFRCFDQSWQISSIHADKEVLYIWTAQLMGSAALT